MPEEKKCPQCGAPLPEGVLAGLCPACLLKQGVTGDTGPSVAFTPPSLDELTRLFPQLEILELIGTGGMGAVYKARQRELDRIVALKILPPGIGDRPGFAERFTREAKALAKLNHPGIVTIHDTGRVDGLYYLLMEFVDGVNLRQLLRAGRIEPREALAIVPQICDALQYAHDAGIVHRDIKPENILLDRQGRVKVADFGLAKLVGQGEAAATDATTMLSPTTTEAGQVMGTPQYMAPEQRATPSDVDHRADIYSLGVVFYQMLTGELPGKELQPPSKKVVVDVRLDEVVLRALEKKPELRYQQAGDVKTMVETIATTPPTQPATLPGGAPSRVDSAPRSHSTTPTKEVRWLMWGLGSFALVMFGMLALALSRPWFWIAGIAGGGAAVLFFLGFILLCPKQFCPRCRAQLPKVRMPRTLSQMLWGGWTCAYCGCELDRHARPASAKSSPPPVVAIPASDNLPNATPPPPASPAASSAIFGWLALGLFAGGLLVMALLVGLSKEEAGAFVGVVSLLLALVFGIIGRRHIGGRIALWGIGVCVVLAVASAGLLYLKAREMQQAAYARQVEEMEKARRAFATKTTPPERAAAAGQLVMDFDWQQLAAAGRLRGGKIVTMDSRRVLKIENTTTTPLSVPILELEHPSITAMQYAVTGELQYENVSGTGYVEMWSHFAPFERYFSRTLGAPDSGPMAGISGTTGWREFSLPFDRTGTTNTLSRLEVNLYLPARGVVYFRAVKLVQGHSTTQPPAR